jgi:hypothetical protein
MKHRKLKLTVKTSSNQGSFKDVLKFQDATPQKGETSGETNDFYIEGEEKQDLKEIINLSTGQMEEPTSTSLQKDELYIGPKSVEEDKADSRHTPVYTSWTPNIVGFGDFLKH